MTNTTEAALRDALIEVQRTLEKPQPAIACTIWCANRPAETLLDFVTDALSQPSPASSTAGDRDALVDALRGNLTPILEWELWKDDRPRNKDEADRLERRKKERDDAIDRILSSLSPSSGEPASVAGEAWQLVPVKITKAMLDATCCDERDDLNMRHTWKELLYAAPKPPVSLSKPTPVEAGLREALDKIAAWDDPSPPKFLPEHVCIARAAISETLPGQEEGANVSSA